MILNLQTTHHMLTLFSPFYKVSTPANAPRLVDLVTPAHPGLAVAFFYALRNTLVGEDLDHATELAFPGGRGGKAQWRAVTLTGQLIDTSGTMAGGGNRQFRGRMTLASGRSKAASGGRGAGDAFLVTPEDVAALEEEVKRLTSLLAEGKAEVLRLRNEVHAFPFILFYT